MPDMPKKNTTEAPIAPGTPRDNNLMAISNRTKAPAPQIGSAYSEGPGSGDVGGEGGAAVTKAPLPAAPQAPAAPINPGTAASAPTDLGQSSIHVHQPIDAGAALGASAIGGAGGAALGYGLTGSKSGAVRGGIGGALGAGAGHVIGGMTGVGSEVGTLAGGLGGSLLGAATAPGEKHHDMSAVKEQIERYQESCRVQSVAEGDHYIRPANEPGYSGQMSGREMIRGALGIPSEHEGGSQMYRRGQEIGPHGNYAAFADKRNASSEPIRAYMQKEFGHTGHEHWDKDRLLIAADHADEHGRSDVAQKMRDRAATLADRTNSTEALAGQRPGFLGKAKTPTQPPAIPGTSGAATGGEAANRLGGNVGPGGVPTAPLGGIDLTQKWKTHPFANAAAFEGVMREAVKRFQEECMRQSRNTPGEVPMPVKSHSSVNGFPGRANTQEDEGVMKGAIGDLKKQKGAIAGGIAGTALGGLAGPAAPIVAPIAGALGGSIGAKLDQRRSEMASVKEAVDGFTAAFQEACRTPVMEFNPGKAVHDNAAMLAGSTVPLLLGGKLGHAPAMVLSSVGGTVGASLDAERQRKEQEKKERRQMSHHESVEVSEAFASKSDVHRSLGNLPPKPPEKAASPAKSDAPPKNGTTVVKMQKKSDQLKKSGEKQNDEIANARAAQDLPSHVPQHPVAAHFAPRAGGSNVVAAHAVHGSAAIEPTKAATKYVGDPGSVVSPPKQEHDSWNPPPVEHKAEAPAAPAKKEEAPKKKDKSYTDKARGLIRKHPLAAVGLGAAAGYVARDREEESVKEATTEAKSPRAAARAAGVAQARAKQDMNIPAEHAGNAKDFEGGYKDKASVDQLRSGNRYSVHSREKGTLGKAKDFVRKHPLGTTLGAAGAGAALGASAMDDEQESVHESFARMAESWTNARSLTEILGIETNLGKGLGTVGGGVAGGIGGGIAGNMLGSAVGMPGLGTLAGMAAGGIGGGVAGNKLGGHLGGLANKVSGAGILDDDETPDDMSGDGESDNDKFEEIEAELLKAGMDRSTAHDVALQIMTGDLTAVSDDMQGNIMAEAVRSFQENCRRQVSEAGTIMPGPMIHMNNPAAQVAQAAINQNGPHTPMAAALKNVVNPNPDVGGPMKGKIGIIKAEQNRLGSGPLPNNAAAAPDVKAKTQYVGDPGSVVSPPAPAHDPWNPAPAEAPAAAAPAAAPAAAGAAPAKGMLDKATDWAKKNPGLATGAALGAGYMLADRHKDQEEQVSESFTRAFQESCRRSNVDEGLKTGIGNFMKDESSMATHRVVNKVANAAGVKDAMGFKDKPAAAEAEPRPWQHKKIAARAEAEKAKAAPPSPAAEPAKAEGTPGWVAPAAIVGAAALMGGKRKRRHEESAGVKAPVQEGPVKSAATTAAMLGALAFGGKKAIQHLPHADAKNPAVVTAMAKGSAASAAHDAKVAAGPSEPGGARGARSAKPAPNAPKPVPPVSPGQARGGDGGGEARGGSGGDSEGRGRGKIHESRLRESGMKAYDDSADTIARGVIKAGGAVAGAIPAATILGAPAGAMIGGTYGYLNPDEGVLSGAAKGAAAGGALGAVGGGIMGYRQASNIADHDERDLARFNKDMPLDRFSQRYSDIVHGARAPMIAGAAGGVGLGGLAGAAIGSAYPEIGVQNGALVGAGLGGVAGAVGGEYAGFHAMDNAINQSKASGKFREAKGSVTEGPLHGLVGGSLAYHAARQGGFGKVASLPLAALGYHYGSRFGNKERYDDAIDRAQTERHLRDIEADKRHESERRRGLRDGVKEAADRFTEAYRSKMGVKEDTYFMDRKGRIVGALTGAATGGALGAGTAYLSGGDPIKGAMVGALPGASIGSQMGNEYDINSLRDRLDRRHDRAGMTEAPTKLVAARPENLTGRAQDVFGSAVGEKPMKAAPMAAKGPRLTKVDYAVPQASQDSSSGGSASTVSKPAPMATYVPGNHEAPSAIPVNSPTDTLFQKVTGRYGTRIGGAESTQEAISRFTEAYRKQATEATPRDGHGFRREDYIPPEQAQAEKEAGYTSPSDQMQTDSNPKNQPEEEPLETRNLQELPKVRREDELSIGRRMESVQVAKVNEAAAALRSQWMGR